MNQNPYESPVPNKPEPVEADYSCPQCGKTCEAGVLQALGSINWFPKVASFKLNRPEKLSSKTLPLETRLKAIRCRNCDKIIVSLNMAESGRE